MSDNVWNSKIDELFVSDKETKVAVCSLCNKSISFKTSIINLVQHLALEHPESLFNSLPLVLVKEEELQQEPESSILINKYEQSIFFAKCQDSERVRCTLCQENISCKATSSHLKSKHVDVYNSFIASKTASHEDVSDSKNDLHLEVYKETECSSDAANISEVLSEVVINSDGQYLTTDNEYIIISSKAERAKRKRTSEIWKIFKQLDNHKNALCLLCQRILSFRSTITNLKNHLKTRHPLVFRDLSLNKELPLIDNFDKDAEISEETFNSENEEDTTLQPHNNTAQEVDKINIWQYFDKIENTKHAMCTLCQNILSFETTTTNLYHHLSLKHSEIELPKRGSQAKRGSRPEVFIWDIFERIKNTKKAMCTLCQKILSFESNIYNLKHHVRMMHFGIYQNKFLSLPSASAQNGSEEESSSKECISERENSKMGNDSDIKHLLEISSIRTNSGNVWKFFDQIKNTKKGICTLCQKHISYESTISNLKLHLKRRHPLTYLKDFISSKSTFTQKKSEEESCSKGYIIRSEDEKSEAGNNSDVEDVHEDSMLNSSELTRVKRSKIWKVFDKISNTKKATCTLCQNVLSFESTISNLKYHIKRRHPMMYHKIFISPKAASPQNDSEEEGGSKGCNNRSDDEKSEAGNNSDVEDVHEDSMLNSSKLTRVKRSKIWKVFDKISNTKKATCTLCQNVLSFESTISNLKYHIKRRHPVMYHKIFILSKAASPQTDSEEESCSEGDISVQEKSKLRNDSNVDHLLENSILKSSNNRKNRSNVWKFFDHIQNTKRATCTLCQKDLSFESTTSNLRNHLEKLHPVVFQKDFISSKATHNNSEEESGSEGYNIMSADENSEAGNHSDVEHLLEDHKLNSSKLARVNRSNIWNVFDRISNTNKATCTLCQKHLSFESTISNLKSHLERLHPVMYQKVFFSSKSASPQNGSEENSSEDDNSLLGKNTEGADLAKDNNILNTLRFRWKIKSDVGNTRDGKFNSITSSNNDSVEDSYKTNIKNLEKGLKNKHKKAESKFMSSPSNIHEVYISAAKVQEEDNTQDTVFNFDDNSEIKGCCGDKKQTDPFDDGELMIVEPPKKVQRIHSTNWIVKIQPDEKKYIDMCLLKLITEDFQPFTIVEDKGFQEFVAALNPNYHLPTRETLSTLLAEEYTSKMTKYNQFTHHCSSISLTLDCWSSRNMQCFMTVTAHYIDQNTFEFCSVLIECAALHGPPTAERIASELLQVTSKWDITNKVKFIVSDNESNMVSAAQILKWPHYACYAHKYNLMVLEALSDSLIDKVVSKVQIVVAYLKSSYMAKEMLHEYQVKTQQVSQPKTLSLSIPICWITVYTMLKRCNELQQAVSATISNIDEEGLAVTSEEWQCIDQIVEVLKPFEEAANIMTTENYLIAGKAVVLTAGLYKVCTDLEEREFCEPVANLILKLKNGLSTNFGDMEKNEEISICTLLDPKFKQHAFEDHAAMLNAKQRVLEKLKKLSKDSKINNGISTSPSNSKPMPSLLGLFYTKVAASYTHELTEHKSMDELNRYLSENVIPPTECSLRWWKERRMLYPALSKIFIACSNIVVTSLPCKRAFSTTGQTITERRMQLTTSKVDKIMFLNVNK